MKTRLLAVAVAAIALTMMIGCIQPFDKPELVTIEPSQTAFLVPLKGDITEQKGFMSEEYLAKAKISTKEIQIPHRWLQEGRGPGTGRHIPIVKLIVVERKPVTREWTESPSTGTSTKNEGIQAESQESIGFMVRMNASAQIDEVDAVRFLFRYNNKPLEDIMDSEIRARIESKFVEECAKLPLDDVIKGKEKIMKAVRDDVFPYFKDRGITITVLGFKGEFTYLNPEIQTAIDSKFIAARERAAQADINAKNQSKADADAQIANTLRSSGGLDYQMRVLAADNQKRAIEKWDGHLPTALGSQTVFGLPTK